MNNLTKAIRIAVDAHWGQKDRGGQDYAGHLVRVAGRFIDDATQSVAILHDVVEDTPTTLDGLRRQGISEDVIAGVDAITRRTDESYNTYIMRVKENALARAVKISDIYDNLRFDRAGADPEIQRWVKEKRGMYFKALGMLDAPSPVE